MSRIAEFFPARQNTAKIIRELQTKARQSRTWGRRTVWAVCGAYRHSPMYGIDQGHPQPYSQAMAGRRKCRGSRELALSSRQSRLTDVGKINSKSRAIVLSRTALSRGTVAPLEVRAPPAARSSEYPPRAPLVLTIRSDARALQPLFFFFNHDFTFQLNL